jgi:hypothetical protein
VPAESQSSATSHNKGMRALIVRLGVATSLLLVLVGWAVASPLGASPDDDYHLASIWCSEFSYLHPCAEVPGERGGASLLVPAVVIESHICFAFQPNSTADCADGVADNLRLTDRVNQVQGWYPGGYYTAMSVLASPNYTTSVFWMRFTNAAIVVVLLTVFLFIGRLVLQRSALLVLPVMFVPVGMFLFASTNPSAWTIAGSIFYFLFGMNAMYSAEEGKPYAISLVMAGLSAVLALVSRVDGSAFLVVITVAMLALAGRVVLTRARVPALTLGLVAFVAAGYFFFQGFGPAGSPATLGQSRYVGGLFITNVLEVPGFLGGAVGAGPLGWVDTAMPGLVASAGLLLVGALMFWGLGIMGWNKSVSAALVFVSAFGIPVLLAQQQRIEVLEFVQARYLLPLLAILVLIVVITPPPRIREKFPVTSHVAMTVLICAVGAAALWANFHRYAYGSDEPYFGRNLEPVWTGLLGDPSRTFLVVGALAMVAFAAGMAYLYRSEDHDGSKSPVMVKETS